MTVNEETKKENKKIIFSGMQPTGLPSLGNYLGALKNWVKLQDDYNCVYCIVDMHAITVRQNPAELRKRCRELLTLFISVGLDPDKCIIYYQSQVPAHAQLSWVLNCYTYMGELGRMTQFKEKSKKHSENINVGLFAYPVLQAADILLFQADLVPVGEDQRQHLELSRDVAARFNSIYENTFVVPEPYIVKEGAKIMSLQEPTKKMSKSDINGDNSVIYLLDEPNVIVNKVKRAVTDSGSEVCYSDEKPGISNLLNIYCAVTNKTISEAEKEFEGKGYGFFKQCVGETVADALKPIQERFRELTNDKSYIDNIIIKNGEKANYLALKTIRKVYKKIGFPQQ